MSSPCRSPSVDRSQVLVVGRAGVGALGAPAAFAELEVEARVRVVSDDHPPAVGQGVRVARAPVDRPAGWQHGAVDRPLDRFGDRREEVLRLGAAGAGGGVASGPPGVAVGVTWRADEVTVGRRRVDGLPPGPTGSASAPRSATASAVGLAARRPSPGASRRRDSVGGVVAPQAALPTTTRKRTIGRRTSVTPGRARCTA